MFEKLRNLFRSPSDSGEQCEPLSLAVAMLLISAARVDGSFELVERNAVQALLMRRFGLPPDRLGTLMETADHRAQNSTDLYSVTRNIKDALSADERVGMIEMLWEVCYADGNVDDYQANLVRRVAGLLYVSDVESGSARKRIADRLGIQILPG